jgi:DNA-binding transcriptional regulator YiaG
MAGKRGLAMTLNPEEVTALRMRLGMSKPELSRALGLQEDACRAWENGRKACTGTSALALRLYAKLSETSAGKRMLKAAIEA